MSGDVVGAIRSGDRRSVGADGLGRERDEGGEREERRKRVVCRDCEAFGTCHALGR